MKTEVATALKKIGGRPPFKFQPLVGDASNRIYTRLVDDENRTWMLMEYPPGAQSVAEEQTPGDTKRFNEFPFVNVQRYLKMKSVNVPEIYSVGPNYLIVEDLGDYLLYDVFEEEGGNAKIIENLYKKSLDELIKLQVPDEKYAAECIGYSRRYDAAIYNWEFEHFLDYGIEWLVGPIEDRDKLLNYFAAITEQLVKLPISMVHRDYHSKNLIYFQDSIWVIDFQDLIVAPCHYDVASLLYDSYVDLPDSLVDKMARYFFDHTDEKLTGGSYDEFLKETRLIALQRNMKAAGRFVYIYEKKKKTTHLPYIRLTLRKIADHLKFLGASQALAAKIPYDDINSAVDKILTDE